MASKMMLWAVETVLKGMEAREYVEIANAYFADVLGGGESLYYGMCEFNRVFDSFEEPLDFAKDLIKGGFNPDHAYFWIDDNGYIRSDDFPSDERTTPEILARYICDVWKDFGSKEIKKVLKTYAEAYLVPFDGDFDEICNHFSCGDCPLHSHRLGCSEVLYRMKAYANEED